MNSPPSSGYVLRFISGKYQGSEFPIAIGQQVIIGRSSDLDMVLVEDMVSRQHSRISTENNSLYIEDLGSTNGTFVNGEKVFAKKELTEGDRILVGTNIIKLVPASESSGKPIIAPHEPGQDEGQFFPEFPADNAPGTQTQIFQTHHGDRGPGGGSSMSGLLDEVPLPDLLQLFSTSRKNGVLLVSAQRTGRIYLRDGRVYFALIEERPDTPPDKAFYRMLNWTSGTFALEGPSNETFEQELNASTEALMMEGMRQLDEMRNLGNLIPAMQTELCIEQPLIPPLRALTPELLDTLQLIHNYGEVETILNQSLASDLETLQDMIYLIQNEYVRTN